jgi:LPXTG-motif cell wall-anchored protein
MCLMCYLPFLGALGLASLGGGGFFLRMRKRMRNIGRGGACGNGDDPASECRCGPVVKRKQGA